MLLRKNYNPNSDDLRIAEWSCWFADRVVLPPRMMSTCYCAEGGRGPNVVGSQLRVW
jgi:hypothetical protein